MIYTGLQFTALESLKGLVPKCGPVIVSGIGTGDALVSYWPVLLVSVVKVQEVLLGSKVANDVVAYKA